MHAELEAYLQCSGCSRPFRVEAFVGAGDEVQEGLLICDTCDRRYPVIDGVPRILAAPLLMRLVSGLDAFARRYGLKLPTSGGGVATASRPIVSVAKGFEFEWSKYPEAWPEDERELRKYLGDVLLPADFEGRMVLDAGCGQGRLAYYVSRFGARRVICVDLSEALLQGRAHLGSLGRSVHLVQADIYDLPFPPVFDVVYSIGVLHHLPDPERGFRELVGRVRPGGKIFVWSYGESTVVPLIRLARIVTTRIPRRLMWPLSFSPALALSALNLLYRAASRVPGLRRLADAIPFHQYTDQSFRKLWITAFDHLTTPIVHYYRRQEMEAWLERAGLVDRVVSERWAGRAGSTWRACGTRPIVA